MRHEKYNRSEYNEAMKRKRRNYSAEFKSNVVLELLSGQHTLNELADVNGHDKMDINGHGNSPQSDG
jgi:uncharacterized protein (DUF2141 family)